MLIKGQSADVTKNAGKVGKTRLIGQLNPDSMQKAQAQIELRAGSFQLYFPNDSGDPFKSNYRLE